MVSSSGRYYFRADWQESGFELWTSDGTPGGTSILREYATGQGSTMRNPTEFVPSGGYLYFACDTGRIDRTGLLTGKHHFDGSRLMQQLLENEGIRVKDHQVVDFQRHFWDPSEEL